MRKVITKAIKQLTFFLFRFPNKLFRLILIFLFFSNIVVAQQHDLNEFISIALHNSPLLNDYQNQVMANQIDSLQTRAASGFQVTASSVNSYAPVINGWGYDKAITNGANIYAGVAVTKELTGKNNQKNRYQQFDLLKQKVQNSNKISEQELKKNITSQYLLAYIDWQQYKFDGEMLTLMNNEEHVLKEFTGKGIYKQTDYLLFQISLGQYEFTRQQALNQYRIDLSALNFLCGIADTSLIELAVPNLIQESLPEFTSSVFNQQFVLDSLLLRNAHEKIDFQYKPKVNLFADGGYNSSLEYMPYKNFGTNIGFSVSMPIYDGGQRKLEHDKLTIDEQTRKKYHEFYISQYQQQLQSARQQMIANRQLSDQLKKQINYIQTLLDTYHTLLETGDVSITDYLIAFGNYMNAKNQLLVNDLGNYQIINELNYWNQSK